MIELARGGDRLVDLDPIPFSVTDILESVRDIVLPIAEEKSSRCRLTAPEADFRIGHPVALSRVLLNLTTNALKFTAEGFVEVMPCRTAAGGSSSRFAIPAGHPAPVHGHPLRAVPAPPEAGEYAFSGSGLGLSICRKLVEAMGSALQVETAPGVAPGSTSCWTCPWPARPSSGEALIDFDNVTMGIRSDLQRSSATSSSDIIKGKVAVQRAYADWRRYPQYIVPLAESSIDMIMAPAYGSSKKNATDIRLAVDAMELVFTRPEIGTFILLSGDSDFSTS